nr:hypothetical protein [Streptomyces sp. REN17]
MSRRRIEEAGAGESAGFGDPRDTGAEVGETKVVDVQPGETRVVDVQLGESRIADAHPHRQDRRDRRDRQDGPAEDDAARIRPESSTTADVRLGWDAVTVTEDAEGAAGGVEGATGGAAEEASASPPGRQGRASAGETATPDHPPQVPPGAADPVKALMHRHRELCEQAVDPLEIAAGLEAHGVTDRTAPRFRHRDVFSLADEMYARVPRVGDTAPPPGTPDAPGARAGWAVLALLPGALCAAAVTALRYTEGRARLAVTVVGVLAVVLGLRAAFSRGPLHVGRAWSPAPATRAWSYWLVAYALLGDGLLTASVGGGPDGPPTGSPGSSWPIALASVVTVTAACAPAAWCAHLFAVRAQRRLATSDALEDFAASVRPLLLGVLGLYLCALAGLLTLSGAVLHESAAYAGTGALGALLLLARLLAAHGFTHAPAVVLATAGAAEAVALLSVFAGRPPGCEPLAVPVTAVVDVWGAEAVPALVCGTAALVLLIHATRTLTRASAHAVRGDAP